MGFFPHKGDPDTDILVRATSKNNAQIAIESALLKATREQIKFLESPEWRYLIDKYLPAELRRIEHVSRDENKFNPLEPAYERQQLIIHGQIKETQLLHGRLSDVAGEIKKIEKRLRDLNIHKAALADKVAANLKKIQQSK